jgi:NTE family protein
MPVAFVLSGGGSLGAVQVGMLRALAEHGVQPDLIIGTSVGALNGAFIAAHPGREGIAALGELWGSLRRRDVFPIGPLQGALGYYGLRNSLVGSARLEQLIAGSIGFANLEDAGTSLHVVATEISSGMEVLLSRGNTVKAVLASASIPGVFPPVSIENRQLVDGGVANNTPLSHAIALGATAVYVLPAGFACALVEPPKSALGMALQSLTLLIGRGLAADIEHYHGRCELHVVPPLCPLSVAPTDFSRSAEMIERAYRSTLAWLDAEATNGAPLRDVGAIRPHVHS